MGEILRESARTFEKGEIGDGMEYEGSNGFTPDD